MEPDAIESVRRFNRFYTRQIGVLQEKLLRSAFSLTEARVLYELADREKPAATEIGNDLGLDAGYLSRILGGFERRGLIARTGSKIDGRRSLLSLTRSGKKAFAPLDGRARDEVGAMLTELSAPDRARLIQAMGVIEELLGAQPARESMYRLRPPRSGDLGWIVHLHGALYAAEYGWDERFEALVSGIAQKFLERHDPERERCWIAEKDGEIVGSVLLVKQSRTVARLRLLLVHPKVRGMGLGARLVKECVEFARQASYKKITLWTNSVLDAARRIYEKTGFRLVHEEPDDSFGRPLTAQTWELKL